jgi:hypothetical protein
MDDKAVMSAGMSLANQTVQTVDDIVSAFLAMLSKNANDEQRHILERYGKYIKDGGTLRAIYVEQDHLDDFDDVAKDVHLTYYSVIDNEAGKAMIIYEDADILKVREASRKLTGMGRPLWENTQVSYTDFMSRHNVRTLAETIVDDLDTIKKAKRRLSDAKVEFTVISNPNGTYSVIYEQDDHDIMRREGITDDGKARLYQHKTTLEEVKRLARERQQELAKEHANDKVNANQSTNSRSR